jgi:hypothetical protein
VIPSQSSFLLLLLPVAGLAAPACQKAEQARDLPEIPRLECPEYTPVRRLVHNREREKAALKGQFFVFHQKVNLNPPVDWRQDPISNKSFRFYLHTLDHLDILLQVYARDRNVAALKTAAAHALDWIASNPPGGEATADYAWYDMAAGIRAGYLAYLLRAAAFEGILSEGDEGALVSSLRDHGEYLADEANYARRHNHGLFQDTGLFLLCKYAPFLRRAGEWRKIASSRFLENLRATVHPREFVHLEHSPSYHFDITRMADHMRRLGAGGEELDSLVRRLKNAAGWFVMPDQAVPQIGDSQKLAASDWARETAAKKSGLKPFLQSGYAVVKNRGSYLITTAAFNSMTHKHPDELSFCLAEGGQRIVIDSGHYGYEKKQPERRYAVSSRAHNVLLVDEQSFDLLHSKPYGSGILRTGEGDGWFAIEGVNPLLREQGVNHARLWLYRPAEVLVVVDRVIAREPHLYTRIFHFDPSVSLRWSNAEQIRITGEDFAGSISDHSGRGVSTRVICGQKEPRWQGWSFPFALKKKKACAVEYHARDIKRTFTTALALQDRQTRVLEASKDGQTTRLVLERTGRRVEIEVVGKGKEIKITAAPCHFPAPVQK